MDDTQRKEGEENTRGLLPLKIIQSQVVVVAVAVVVVVLTFARLLFLLVIMAEAVAVYANPKLRFFSRVATCSRAPA